MGFYAQEGKQDVYELVPKHSRIVQRLQLSAWLSLG